MKQQTHGGRILSHMRRKIVALFPRTPETVTWESVGKGQPEVNRKAMRTENYFIPTG
jgi:hypothetical protein